MIESGVERFALHGRTFDARYSGTADWEEIAKAKKLTKGTSVTLWGNGDIKNVKDGKEKIKKYGVDGVLVARSTFGNPWFFKDYIATASERTQVMIHHAQLFLHYRPDLDLRPMRKHLSWYCKGAEGSARLRDKLMKVVTIADLTAVLQ